MRYEPIGKYIEAGALPTGDQVLTIRLPAYRNARARPSMRPARRSLGKVESMARNAALMNRAFNVHAPGFQKRCVNPKKLRRFIKLSLVSPEKRAEMTSRIVARKQAASLSK